MTEGPKGPTPGLLSPERAAARIRHALERNRARIAFPRSLFWGVLWLSVLPPPLAHRIMGALRFGA